MTGLVVLLLRVLTVAALYAFLGWAIYVLWQNLVAVEPTNKRSKIPMISLYSDRPPQPQEYQFKQPEVGIGRSSTVDCTVDAETVSLRHARLIFQHNQWWVEDLRSTNGTFLNGEAVNSPMVITTGDILTFGDVDFLVAISQSSS